MKRKISFFLFLSCLLLSVSVFPVFAGSGGLPGEFMYTGTSTRAFAMGRAMTAFPDDIGAIYLNPAGLVLSGEMELSILNYTPLDALGPGTETSGLQYNFIGAKLPAGLMGTFGAGMIRQSVGGIDLWTEDLELVNENNPSDFQQMSFLGTYGKRLRLIPYRFTSIGVGLNVVMQNFNLPESYQATNSSIGFGLDGGVIQQVTEEFFLGLSIKNLLPPALTFYQSESFPMIVKLGMAVVPQPTPGQRWMYLAFSNLIFTFDIDTVIHLASYYDSGMALSFNTHLGLEKKLTLIPDFLGIALRVGVNDVGIYLDGGGFDMEFTYGLGVLLFNFIQIDLASDTSALGVLNRIYLSATFRFDTHTSNAKGLIALGQKQMKNGNYGPAVKNYTDALEISPKNADVIARLRYIDKEIEKLKLEVAELCTKRVWETARDKIIIWRKTPYFDEFMTVYIDHASNDLKLLLVARKRKDFETRAAQHIKMFPDVQKIKDEINRLRNSDSSRLTVKKKKKPVRESEKFPIRRDDRLRMDDKRKKQMDDDMNTRRKRPTL